MQTNFTCTGLGVQMKVSSADMDLSLDLAEAEGRLMGRLEYSVDLFDHSTIERMGGHLQARSFLRFLWAAPFVSCTMLLSTMQ